MDDSEMYFASSSGYLEGLIKSRAYLIDSPDLASKLNEVISEELDLALLGAKKAKSEILKRNKENTVRPIK